MEAYYYISGSIIFDTKEFAHLQFHRNTNSSDKIQIKNDKYKNMKNLANFFECNVQNQSRNSHYESFRYAAIHACQHLPLLRARGMQNPHPPPFILRSVLREEKNKFIGGLVCK